MAEPFAMDAPLNVFSRPLADSMIEIPYKVILFDLFHTLVEVSGEPGGDGRSTAEILGVASRAWHEACFGDAHEICRRTSQHEVIRALAHAIEPTIPESLIAEASEVRQRRFDHALCRPRPEVEAVLETLTAAGYRLALLSNASTDEVRAWSRSPLARHFEHALFSWECGCAKPQPVFYRLALARMGVMAEEALFVGDGGSNEHRGARALGLDNVLLTHHIGHYDEARMAPRRQAVRWEVATLTELLALLEDMAETRRGA